MRRITALVFPVLLLTVLVFVGCQAPAPEQTSLDMPVTELETELPEQVQKAVGIASAIKTSPGNSEQILAEAEMTADEFEALLYEIAADPKMSELYNRAMVD